MRGGGGRVVEAGRVVEPGRSVEPGRLVVLCGLPGSGKTTLALRIAATAPVLRICPDEWLTALEADLHDEPLRDRLERKLWELAQELLVLGQTVVVEYGSWVREHRDELRLGARALGAAVELYYLDVPLAELMRRIEARNEAEDWGTAAITEAQMREYAAVFQPPDAEEFALFDPPRFGA